jgi:hypothetical protein
MSRATSGPIMVVVSGMARHKMVHRDKHLGHDKLVGGGLLCGGPHVSVEMFLRVVDAVKSPCSYFKYKRNAVGDLGHNALKKITTTIRMLAFGVPAHSLDDSLRIAEGTTILSFRKFVKIKLRYLDKNISEHQTTEDIARLMGIG